MPVVCTRAGYLFSIRMINVCIEKPLETFSSALAQPSFPFVLLKGFALSSESQVCLLNPKFMPSRFILRSFLRLIALQTAFPPRFPVTVHGFGGLKCQRDENDFDSNLFSRTTSEVRAPKTNKMAEERKVMKTL